MEPRCFNHKDRETLPRLCHICQRIAVERDIAEKAVKALFVAGYRLSINNGDDEQQPIISYDPHVGFQGCTDAVLAIMFQTDDEWLLAFKVERALTEDDKRPDAWVRFVYGNDGYDVISDYTTNLEATLKGVNEYADTLAP